MSEPQQQKKPLRIILAIGIALVVGAAICRFLFPQVRVETRTEWKDRIVVQEKIVEKKVEGPVRIKVVTREIPGGERIIVKTIERDPVTTERTSDGQASSENSGSSVTIKEPVGPQWLIGPTAGLRYAGGLRVDYGAAVDRRFLGPLWLGIAGDTQPSVRVRFSLQF